MSDDLVKRLAAMHAGYLQITPWAQHAATCQEAATRIEALTAENAKLREAADEVKRAVDFLDRVRASSDDERAAVGRDHWDWLERAARKIAALEPPK